MCAAALAHAGAPSAQPAVEVPDVRGLLVGAIDAPDGQAHGVLHGPLAEAIANRFRSSFPIHVDVTTERRYLQDGCRRLKVSFWQDGIILPGTEVPRRQTIDFSLNYCRDGMPPRTLKEAP